MATDHGREYPFQTKGFRKLFPSHYFAVKYTAVHLVRVNGSLEIDFALR